LNDEGLKKETEKPVMERRHKKEIWKSKGKDES